MELIFRTSSLESFSNAVLVTRVMGLPSKLVGISNLVILVSFIPVITRRLVF